MAVTSVNPKPSYVVVKCAQCQNAITGSLYTQQKKRLVPQARTICEPCYWAHHYGDTTFFKTYKHSVMNDALDMGADNCKSHGDLSASMRPTFKIRDVHHCMPDNKPCEVFKLRDHEAKAKYEGLLATVGKVPPGNKSTASRMVSRMRSVSKVERVVAARVGTAKRPPTQFGISTGPAEEAMSDTDIPLFYRECAEDYPFAGMHMALRIGPLVIENGVSK